jgi:hypothetical protein
MSKTELISTSDYMERFNQSEQDQAADRLNSELVSILSSLGDLYMTIFPEDLDPEILRQLEDVNLWGVIETELNSEGELNLRLIRFVLREIERLRLQEPHDILLPRIRDLYPVFKYVVLTLSAQDGLTSGEKEALGSQLLALTEHETLGHLEYHRAWILDPFTLNADWGNPDSIARIYLQHDDEATRKCAMLALGQQHVWQFFRPKKSDVFRMNPWERRAFLLGARCLPGDEASFWYKSIRSRLTELERVVVNYAKTI